MVARLLIWLGVKMRVIGHYKGLAKIFHPQAHLLTIDGLG
jgi:hypothetical protein